MVTIQFIPYSKIAALSSHDRVHKLLRDVRDNKILFLEGRLKPEEEALLIETTMQHIDKKFRGIELAVVNPAFKHEVGFGKVKVALQKALLGDRVGFTVIGPATIIKEIKKDPEKIELLMKR
jgi:hypothetical protein